MKKFILASAIIAASFGAAEAKCSKKSLNGNWMMHIAGQGVPIVFAGGAGTAAGYSFTITLNDKCKGTGTLLYSGTTYQATVATEKISASSSLKPNLLEIGVDAGGGSFAVFSFYRR